MCHANTAQGQLFWASTSVKKFRVFFLSEKLREGIGKGSNALNKNKVYSNLVFKGLKQNYMFKVVHQFELF